MMWRANLKFIKKLQHCMICSCKFGLEFEFKFQRDRVSLLVKFGSNKNNFA